MMVLKFVIPEASFFQERSDWLKKLRYLVSSGKFVWMPACTGMTMLGGYK